MSLASGDGLGGVAI